MDSLVAQRGLSSIQTVQEHMVSYQARFISSGLLSNQARREATIHFLAWDEDTKGGE